MGITIRMPFESWISLYCHSSYWLPHVITKHANIQIHFMFVPHVYGLLGVLNILYSQCCDMAAWKLNCLYGHQWNEVLHYAQLLTTSKFMRHCRWYMCWQVPNYHAPFSPNGEQQIMHSFPFYMKVWGVGHKNSPNVFYTTMT